MAVSGSAPSTTDAGSGSPRFSARHKNVAICARVVSRRGQNTVPSPQPSVMPDAASRATSAAYHASEDTSEKSGSGPAARL